MSSLSKRLIYYNIDITGRHVYRFYKTNCYPIRKIIPKKKEEHDFFKSVKLCEYYKIHSNTNKLDRGDLVKFLIFRDSKQDVDNYMIDNLKQRIRSLVRTAIIKQGYKKNSKTEDILGCTWIEFKNHIESYFDDKINWNNMHEWHLDHIKPMAWAVNEIEVYELNHYTNLRPMLAIENIKKSSEYNGVKWSVNNRRKLRGLE